MTQGLNLSFFSAACVKHTVGKFQNARLTYMWLRVLIFHLFSLKYVLFNFLARLKRSISLIKFDEDEVWTYGDRENEF